LACSFFAIFSINLLGDGSLDTNYTYANKNSDSSILTPEEADDIIDSTMVAYEPKALTPEELASVYADIIYSTYAKLGYVPLDIDLPKDEPKQNTDSPGASLHNYVANIPQRKNEL